MSFAFQIYACICRYSIYNVCMICSKIYEIYVYIYEKQNTIYTCLCDVSQKAARPKSRKKKMK